MTTFEKAGAVICVVLFAFTAGIGWNSLNNRIDKVDEKIGGIEKTLGSTACASILTRQIEAIEKNRPEAREALESLSAQYKCIPTAELAIEPFELGENAALAVELNAVDVLLNEGN